MLRARPDRDSGPNFLIDRLAYARRGADGAQITLADAATWLDKILAQNQAGDLAPQLAALSADLWELNERARSIAGRVAEAHKTARLNGVTS